MSDYSSVKATMVEKRGECIHKLGDEFLFESPFSCPKDLCSAAREAFRLYVTMCSLGGDSWEKDNPKIWLLSCPSKKGTVWKLERVEGI
jgi:uncharacterized repeat protein (TIGR04076 family)